MKQFQKIKFKKKTGAAGGKVLLFSNKLAKIYYVKGKTKGKKKEELNFKKNTENFASMPETLQSWIAFTSSEVK